MTMVIVSHELDSIFGIGERMVVLDKTAAGMIALGRPRELAAHPPHPAERDFLTRGGERPIPAA
jgi:phospholipid/cholesterol/gamma-HCH transport system ATP-binding protein